MLASMADQRDPSGTAPASTGEPRMPALVGSIATCPYLSSANRAWVASAPSSDHRCEAVSPATALAAEKQRRLCLSTDHMTCATYLAALEARADRIPSAERSSEGWGWVRTTPVVDGSVGPGAAFAALLSERRGWQVIPAIGLVVALGALGLSNLGTGSGGARPTATATFPNGVVASPSTAARPTPAPSGSDVVASSTSATPAPTIAPPTPAPTAVATAVPPPTATYTVKSGDTLYGIAKQFGVTVTALKSFNNLTSNTLHVGQVLKIP